jgi:hypothetical protein
MEMNEKEMPVVDKKEGEGIKSPIFPTKAKIVETSAYTPYPKASVLEKKSGWQKKFLGIPVWGWVIVGLILVWAGITVGIVAGH